MQTSQVSKSTKWSLPRHAFLLIPLMFACFGLTSAATITVTNNNDGGPGSLRQAISDSSSGDTIDFDSSLNGHTITLTGGELLIDKDLTITGPGANLLVVNGSLASRVFNISAGFEVTVSGLTISFGNAGNANSGGGILNNGSLTIIDSSVSSNTAIVGGGIDSTGSLTITNSTISANRGPEFYVGLVIGGGIRNSGLLTITSSNVIGNVADLGAGISNSGSLTMSHSTLSGNLAHHFIGSGAGGGIDNAGSVTVANSTLSGNGADRDGGGIRNSFGGSVTITNSTLSGNNANNGGGLFNDSATMVLGNIVLNAGVQSANIVNAGTGVVISYGYNLSSDPGGGVLTSPGDRINTDPRLYPLADNGGPTFTHALLPDSPAINAGDPAFNPNDFDPPLTYDQRGPGFMRVAGYAIDIGAFEVQTGPTPTPTATPTATATTTPTATATPTPTSTATPGNPNITVNPLSLAFGGQLVGTGIAQLTTTISNTGTGDLHVGLSFGGANPSDFVVDSSIATITPGNNVTVQVTFTPLAIGARSATLIVSSDDPDEPTINVSLSGTGIAPSATPTPTATATFTPTPTPTATATQRQQLPLRQHRPQLQQLHRRRLQRSHLLLHSLQRRRRHSRQLQLLHLRQHPLRALEVPICSSASGSITFTRDRAT